MYWLRGPDRDEVFVVANIGGRFIPRILISSSYSFWMNGGYLLFVAELLAGGRIGHDVGCVKSVVMQRGQ